MFDSTFFPNLWPHFYFWSLEPYETTCSCLSVCLDLVLLQISTPISSYSKASWLLGWLEMPYKRTCVQRNCPTRRLEGDFPVTAFAFGRAPRSLVAACQARWENSHAAACNQLLEVHEPAWKRGMDPKACQTFSLDFKRWSKCLRHIHTLFRMFYGQHLWFVEKK